jgi:hypothetical protein
MSSPRCADGPERHAWNPHHGEPSGWRSGVRGTHITVSPADEGSLAVTLGGLVAEVPRSGACNGPLLRPF